MSNDRGAASISDRSQPVHIPTDADVAANAAQRFLADVREALTGPVGTAQQIEADSRAHEQMTDMTTHHDSQTGAFIGEVNLKIRGNDKVLKGIDASVLSHNGHTTSWQFTNLTQHARYETSINQFAINHGLTHDQAQRQIFHGNSLARQDANLGQMTIRVQPDVSTHANGDYDQYAPTGYDGVQSRNAHISEVNPNLQIIGDGKPGISFRGGADFGSGSGSGSGGGADGRPGSGSGSGAGSDSGRFHSRASHAADPWYEPVLHIFGY